MQNLPEHVLDKIAFEPNTGHWFWLGALSRDGYGRTTVGGQQTGAHCYLYTHFVGPIPPGLVIDHICRVRHCVAPQHLRAVPRRQNALENSEGFCARRAVSETCERGHPLDDYNTTYQKNGARLCRCCRNAYMRELMAKKRAAQRVGAR